MWQDAVMQCPLCAGSVSTGEDEYHIIEVADDGTEHFWACDSCCWAASVQVPWSSSREAPKPPQTTLGRRMFRLYGEMESLCAAWSSPPTDELAKRHGILAYQLESIRRAEHRIRLAAGNDGPRPRPAIETRFEALRFAENT
jgi:hypothetical protein